MKKFLTIFILLTFSPFFWGGGGVQALMIQGPDLHNDLSWPNSGLAITALQNVWLTSFVFYNRGGADTVYLRNESTSQIIGTTDTPAGYNPLIEVSWAMQAGQHYHLLAQQQWNGKWADFGFTNPPYISPLQCRNFS
jgi:hypothetical protein